MPLSTGQIVHSRYRIARLLGQGGMGAVYRAWDLSLNIPVALKEQVPGPGMDTEALTQLRAQFQREAQVLAGLSHANLPRVTDYFDWNRNVYLVMDFVDGESLEAVIAQRGPLPEAWVVNWATQLLDALEICHAGRIVHRDVKPLNIIIRPDHRAVLVDFGLVKLWDPRHPQTQLIVRNAGTLEYASPEHFYLGGRHTEPRSDLYSLGATMYHAMTGQEPPSALRRWVDHSLLVPPCSLRADIQPQVEKVVLQAMELDPDHRFTGAREMRAALRPGAERHPPPAPRPAEPAQSIHPKRRAPRAASPPRDTRWWIEMVTAAVMALVGVLVIQVILFADSMTLDLYLGRGLWALLLGGLGWFLGDLAFQALAQPEYSKAASGAGRPTQRLVALTRRMTRRMSTAQQVMLLAALLIGTAAAVWLLGPLVMGIPFLVNYVSPYALVGPLAYAATGRRPGRALVAHALVTTVAYTVLGARTGEFSAGIGIVFLTAVGGGLLMEGVAFVVERLILREG